MLGELLYGDSGAIVYLPGKWYIGQTEPCGPAR